MCPRCHAYLQARRPVLLPALGRAVCRTGRPPAQLLRPLLAEAHARHQTTKEAAA